MRFRHGQLGRIADELSAVVAEEHAIDQLRRWALTFVHVYGFQLWAVAKYRARIVIDRYLIRLA